MDKVLKDTEAYIRTPDSSIVRRQRSVLILTAVAIALLICSGTFLALWLDARCRADDLKEQVNSTERILNLLQSQYQQLQQQQTAQKAEQVITNTKKPGDTKESTLTMMQTYDDAVNDVTLVNGNIAALVSSSSNSKLGSDTNLGTSTEQQNTMSANIVTTIESKDNSIVTSIKNTSDVKSEPIDNLSRDHKSPTITITSSDNDSSDDITTLVENTSDTNIVSTNVVISTAKSVDDSSDEIEVLAENVFDTIKASKNVVPSVITVSDVKLTNNAPSEAVEQFSVTSVKKTLVVEPASDDFASLSEGDSVIKLNNIVTPIPVDSNNTFERPQNTPSNPIIQTIHVNIGSIVHKGDQLLTLVDESANIATQHTADLARVISIRRKPGDPFISINDMFSFQDVYSPLNNPFLPMKIIEIKVHEGQVIAKGDVLVKGEMQGQQVTFKAQGAAIVEKILVNSGDYLEKGTDIMTFTAVPITN